MSTLGFSAPDLDALAANAGRAIGVLEDLTDVNRAAGDDVLGAAKPPVRTGRLRDSGEVQADALGFTVAWTAPYAPYVRSPFAQAAVDDALGIVTERYADALQAAADALKP